MTARMDALSAVLHQVSDRIAARMHSEGELRCYVQDLRVSGDGELCVAL